MGRHQVRIIIPLTLLLCLAFVSNIPQTTAYEYDMPWDLEAGVLFPCRYITGTNVTGTLDLWEQKVFLRIENEPDYLYNIETWDDLPDVNVSMIDANGFVTDPDSFPYLIQDAGLTWTGHDWYKPAIPYLGVYEDTWNSVYGDLIQTWVGPWGFDINVTIIPDPSYEVNSIWDQTFWAVQYNFTYDSVFYDVMVSYWLYPSPSPSPYNSGLLQNVTITGADATSGEVMNFFQIICDPSPPRIWNHAFIIYPEDSGRTSAESLNYTVGDTGYAIWWNIDEDYPVDYVVYDNETVFASGPMNFTYYGADDHLELSLDGLEVGVHNLSLVVTNTIGITGSDWVLINVTISEWLLEGATPQILMLGGVGISIVLIAGVVYIRRRR